MTAQVAMAVLGATLLLGTALPALVLPGAHLPNADPLLTAWVAGTGAWPGWLAVLLAAAVAGWMQGWKSSPATHVAAALGFAVSILVACCFASHGGEILFWHGYHVLQTAWVAWAAILLAVAIAGPWISRTPSSTAWVKPIWVWRIVLDACSSSCWSCSTVLSIRRGRGGRWVR